MIADSRAWSGTSTVHYRTEREERDPFLAWRKRTETESEKAKKRKRGREGRAISKGSKTGYGTRTVRYCAPPNQKQTSLFSSSSTVIEGGGNDNDARSENERRKGKGREKKSVDGTSVGRLEKRVFILARSTAVVKLAAAAALLSLSSATATAAIATIAATAAIAPHRRLRRYEATSPSEDRIVFTWS